MTTYTHTGGPPRKSRQHPHTREPERLGSDGEAHAPRLEGVELLGDGMQGPHLAWECTLAPPLLGLMACRSSPMNGIRRRRWRAISLATVTPTVRRMREAKYDFASEAERAPSPRHAAQRLVMY